MTANPAWSRVLSWFIPKFSWIQVEVTSFCNASCLYCPRTVYRDLWRNRHLSLDTFQRLLPSLSRTRLVYLQGWGEPFLNPDFFTMLALAKQARCRVGITTNGMLLDEKTCDQLVALGLDTIAFSLAGADAAQDRVRQGTGFGKVLEAIRTLNRAKERAGRALPQINIAYMLLRSGLGDLEKLPAALKGLGIAEVMISTLDFVAARELEGECVILGSPEEYRELGLRLENLRAAGERQGLKIMAQLPPPSRGPSLCPEKVQRALVVSGEGEVSPCVFTNLPVSGTAYAAPEGEVPYRRLIFGNIKEQPLHAIWRQPAYANFRRSFFTGKLARPCRHCRKLGYGQAPV